MITKETVSAKLLAYMNGEISQAELVGWAETCFIEGGFAPDEDIPLLWDVVIDFIRKTP